MKKKIRNEANRELQSLTAAKWECLGLFLSNQMIDDLIAKYSSEVTRFSFLLKWDVWEHYQADLYLDKKHTNAQKTIPLWDLFYGFDLR